MDRELHRVSFRGRTATLSFSRSTDAQEFENLIYTAFCTNQSGSWPFVIGSITCGVDWPAWWPRYEKQRDLYLDLIGGSPLLKDLKISAKERQKEMWRRYDLCSNAGIATCEDVHYPDFFEIEGIVKPQVLDSAREGFPAGVFGPYIMACPPGERLIDPDNPGSLNGVWADKKDFFIDGGLLVSGKETPVEVIAKLASNQSLRTVITRHGERTRSTRSENELTFIKIANKESGAADELRNLYVPKGLWCRMPPHGLSWEQLQAYRWLVRGIGGSLFDMYEGLSRKPLAAPE